MFHSFVLLMSINSCRYSYQRFVGYTHEAKRPILLCIDLSFVTRVKGISVGIAQLASKLFSNGQPNLVQALGSWHELGTSEGKRVGKRKNELVLLHAFVHSRCFSFRSSPTTENRQGWTYPMQEMIKTLIEVSRRDKVGRFEGDSNAALRYNYSQLRCCK